jgi:hypothetical protein
VTRLSAGAAFIFRTRGSIPLTLARQ